jgi:SagB-type dehydrogenase family enzyme
LHLEELAPVSVAQRYHELTKYAPETIAAHPGLDWDAKPSLFKRYHADEPVDLGPSLLLEKDPVTGMPIVPAELISGRMDIGSISTILLHSYGITAVMEDGDDEHFFRAAPSAGALYPNEIYVAVRDVEGIPDGLHHYQIIEHQLIPVCTGEFWPDLEAQLFEHPSVSRARCVFVLSAIFERSAWRYRERGYRRVLLDSGHVLGNLVGISEALELEPQVIGGFNDCGLGQLFWLDAETEGALCAIPVLDRGQRAWPTVALASPAKEEPVTAEGCARALHLASSTRIAQKSGRGDPLPPPPAIDGEAVKLRLREGSLKEGLPAAILLRRSARLFRRDPVQREQFERTLAAGLAPLRDGAERPGSSHGFLDAGLLRTWVSIHRVEGIEPGLYGCDPVTGQLFPRRQGDFSRNCCHIALGQDIALDAAFSIFHTARVDEAVERYGERGYRYLGLDAGHLGERLVLAAGREEIGACGIGGYFDDEVNALFEMERDEAVVYMTCFGLVPDTHRVTLE